MLQYERKEVAQDDCLWLARTMYIDIFQNKFVKILLLLFFIALTIFLAIQTFLFLLRFDGRYFLKYLTLYITSLFLYLSIIAIQTVMQTMQKAADELERWKIDSAGIFIEQKIRKEATNINTFITVNTIVSLLCGFFHMLPEDNDRNIFFALGIIDEFLPEWSFLLTSLARVSVLFLPIIMLAIPYQFIYLASHFKYQTYLLTYYLQNLNNYDDKIGDNFHKEIKKRLVFCIQRHSRIITVARKTNNKVSVFIFLFTITAAILGISLVFYFLFQHSLRAKVLRVGTFVIAAGLAFVLVSEVGQQIENMSSDAYNILKTTDWYDWNKENKKIYLIILSVAQKPYQIEFSESMLINYQLGVSVAKAIYSTVSVWSQIKNVEF